MSKCFTLVVELVNVTDITASWTNFSYYKLLTYLSKWEEKRRELELAERDGEGKNKKKTPFSWVYNRQAKFSILVSADSLRSRTSKSTYTPRILPASLT